MTTKIEWTEATWNPVTGCTKISDGCANCYAEKMARRLHLMGQKKYKNSFNVTLHDDVLREPLSWNKRKMVFVCSMSDLFHKGVPFDFIDKVFFTMRHAENCTFQVLTKRSERLAEYAQQIKWPSNVWAGVTVESSKYKNRIDDLRNVDAPVRFLSIEPLLDNVGILNLSEIDWVIVGGESGPKARPVEKEWVEGIHRQCLNMGVPFFFKQWGGVNKKKAGRELNHKTYDEMPLALV